MPFFIFPSPDLESAFSPKSPISSTVPWYVEATVWTLSVLIASGLVIDSRYLQWIELGNMYIFSLRKSIWWIILYFQFKFRTAELYLTSLILYPCLLFPCQNSLFLVQQHNHSFALSCNTHTVVSELQYHTTSNSLTIERSLFILGLFVFSMYILLEMYKFLLTCNTNYSWCDIISMSHIFFLKSQTAYFQNVYMPIYNFSLWIRNELTDRNDYKTY